MNIAIQTLEKEILARQKVLHYTESATAKRKAPTFLLTEIAELKQAVKMLRQQLQKTEKKKYAFQ